MSTETAKRSTTGALTMKQRKTDELKPSSALTAEPKKVIIKSADMKDDMQKEAVNIAIFVSSFSAFEKNNVEKDVAEYIKKEFDKKHGPTLHCIVGCNFEHGEVLQVLH
ncbi:hypothetical protein ES319_A12G205500v1 [Gossypium barbadense]|uniref:Dynein light chain n=2 Tax=Gossypium TaxID=3633 RepID=A0A5J5TDX2_GOSBA|nr:hypothetical protein ES319_A12G205500v1 [Gossypium barbadense]TYG90953.1 hypothetical protein ES288_A12G224400v1 [Gossypium darwinii]